jgi:hypothetical protein
VALQKHELDAIAALSAYFDYCDSMDQYGDPPADGPMWDYDFNPDPTSDGDTQYTRDVRTVLAAIKRVAGS